MILKNNLKNLKKVGVSIWVDRKSGIKMANGKYSYTFRVYDATPDEVVKVIQKALEQESKKN